MHKSQKKKIFSTIANIAFYIVILAMLGGAVLFAASGAQDKSIFGYRAYEALSNSMSPSISKGDMLLVKITPAAEAKPGDIITVAAGNEGTTVTHRLVDSYLDENGTLMLITKGDANEQEDTPVSGANMIGVVSKTIPALGGMLGGIRGNPLKLILPLAGIIILTMGVRYLLRQRKNTNSPQPVPPTQPAQRINRPQAQRAHSQPVQRPRTHKVQPPSANPVPPPHREPGQAVFYEPALPAGSKPAYPLPPRKAARKPRSTPPAPAPKPAHKPIFDFFQRLSPQPSEPKYVYKADGHSYKIGHSHL